MGGEGAEGAQEQQGYLASLALWIVAEDVNILL